MTEHNSQGITTQNKYPVYIKERMRKTACPEPLTPFVICCSEFGDEIPLGSRKSLVGKMGLDVGGEQW